MKQHQIIIVDDHVLFSQALKGLIDDFEEFSIQAVLGNGKELITWFEENTKYPAVILMDINMPIMDGIEATKWLNDHHPDVKVLALSMDDHETTIISMLRAGAKGYLLKDIHPKILRQGINDVIEKGIYYTERVTNSILNTYKPDNGASAVLLKPRELEFLKLACTDKTYKEIASDMCLSPKTIDGYREALFAKLEVRNRIGLVLYGIKEKLVVL
ncbi:MAG: response regulator transcription factor [Flavobacteriaceae bacterium]|nr:response regulator transcription factor [Flavobacteriaceae bacterium]